jgi:serine/threonine protein kinase
MSLDKPLDLDFIGKGSYGVIMKKKTTNDIIIIKQFRVEYYDNNTNSFDKETKYANLANNINPDIFIKIIKEEILEDNLAKKININVPFINNISINTFGYIHMEYMNHGDLYEFIKTDRYFNIVGILGCYLNGLNILHNDLNIIHGDLTPNNILVHYIGPHYRQKIILNNDIYYFDTKGYNFKISDFGLSELINTTKHKNVYMNYLYRDYLVLYYLYFNKHKFYNYNKFIDLIELCLGQINDDLFDGYKNTQEYHECFLKEFNYHSVCKFMNICLESNLDNTLIYDIPLLLLNEFIDIMTII